MQSLFSRLPLALAVLMAAGCALPGMTGSTPNQPNGVTFGLKGQMQFDFKYPDPPAQRRLLTTIEDVAFYRITIKKPDGSIARGPDLYAAPTPTTRQVSHRISDLEPGTYTVLIEALDANQAPIGQAQTDVTVVAGQCQLVPITIHLDNDILLPTVGKIGLAVDVQDGAVVQPSTPCCSIPPEYLPLDPAPSATPTPTPSPTPTPGYAIAHFQPYATAGFDGGGYSIGAGYITPDSAGNVAGLDWIGWNYEQPKHIETVTLNQGWPTSDCGYVTSVLFQGTDIFPLIDPETAQWNTIKTQGLSGGVNSFSVPSSHDYKAYRILANSNAVNPECNEYGTWEVLEVEFN